MIPPIISEPMPLRVGGVEVSAGFLVLAAWLYYSDREGVFLWVLASCLCHELGHLLALHLLRVPVRKVRITAVGAEICVAGGMSYRGELAAALAGPTVNLLLAALVSRRSGGELLAGINLALGVFNLIPVGRLDGGRAMECVLSLGVGPEVGRRVVEVTSWVFAVGLLVLGCCLLRWGGNGTLLLIALWMTVSVAGFGGKRRN